MSSAKKIKKTGFIYYISKGTDNPKIFAKLTADGRESLHLEYYFGHKEVVDEETGKVAVNVARNRLNSISGKHLARLRSANRTATPSNSLKKSVLRKPKSCSRWKKAIV